jgi:hypothetical protein
VFGGTFGAGDGVELCAIGLGVTGGAELEVPAVDGVGPAFGAVEIVSGTFEDCGLVFASAGFRHIIFPQEV